MNIVSRKVALVTGAAAGIGRATAIKFSKEGTAPAVAYYREAGPLYLCLPDPFDEVTRD